MKALTTINVFIFCLIIILIMLSSCALTHKLSSQHPNYHLKLVKANEYIKPPQNAFNANNLKGIESVSQKGITSGNKYDNLPIVISTILSDHVNYSKVKVNRNALSKDETTDGIKNIRRVIIHYKYNNKFKSYRLPVKERSNLLDKPINLFIICLVCTALAVVCFVFAPQIPVLTFFGSLIGIAALVFFCVWLLALADNYYD